MCEVWGWGLKSNCSGTSEAGVLARVDVAAAAAVVVVVLAMMCVGGAAWGLYAEVSGLR